jgi:hypothetical protein
MNMWSQLGLGLGLGMSNVGMLGNGSSQKGNPSNAGSIFSYYASLFVQVANLSIKIPVLLLLFD